MIFDCFVKKATVLPKKATIMIQISYLQTNTITKSKNIRKRKMMTQEIPYISLFCTSIDTTKQVGNGIGL